LTRGDRCRNERIERLRGVVCRDRAILAVDLGEDKQVGALMDHDGRVLARRTVVAKAYELGGLLTWAWTHAQAANFAGVVVACEPTGHRWRAVMDLADRLGMEFVCVNSFQVHLARETDDLTLDKTDNKDTVLIGRLVAQLRCYLPERPDEDWARLRHLGARRERLVSQATAARLQIGDLLASCWPASLACATKPIERTSWLACMAVVVDADGDLAALGLSGADAFSQAARQRLARFGAQRLNARICRGFFAALSDPAGVAVQRRGALERVGLLLTDWCHTAAQLQDTERRMVAVLDALGLTDLVTSIPGVSAVGASTILAQTGDLSRFASARAVVKHAGLSPSEKLSATFRGTTHVSHRGRPTLRLAAWRVAWGALKGNQLLAARFTHLTTRDKGRLTAGQARAACAATLLRWLHAIVTRRCRFDAATAAGAHTTRSLAAAA
jgi:transposase